VKQGEFGRSQGSSLKQMTRFVCLSAAALSALLFAAPARAELVVFSDGRVVKAAGYEVFEADQELEVRLRGGGSYRVDLSLIERIVEDEVEVSEVVVQSVGAPEPVAYDLSYKDDRQPLFASAYDAIIRAEAKKNDVDASLVSALIRAESNYEPRAVSRKGARGLMQLMPATAKRLSVKKPFDPASNVSGGVRYLKELLKRFKHRPELVLAAYNAGERAVETYGGVPPYRETVCSVNKIHSRWTPAIDATVSPAASPGSGGVPPESN
jgi:soluble lytic murein transglycosylase-like protein